MSWKRVSFAALGLVALVSLVMAVWRLSLIALGPDPDGDAYGHYVISRSLMDAPLKHGKHWVWLPVFHWLQLPLLYLDGTMDTIRRINVGVWAAVPVLLTAFLLESRISSKLGLSGTTPQRVGLIAALAGVLAALTPLGMQMGTTAQPEPLFALLVLTFAWLMQKRRFTWASAVLSVLVLLRYEAWAVWAFSCVGVLWQERRAWLQGHDPARVRRATLGVMLLPLLAVLGWAVLRYPHDERWFAFIGGTHDFVTGALRQKSSFEQGIAVLSYDAIRYLWLVPYRTFGLATLLVPFGFWLSFTRHRWLTIACGGVLAFITLSWLTRSTLGLERHFVAVLVWYATMIVYGAELLVSAAVTRIARWTPSVVEGVKLAVLAPVLALLTGVVWLRTDEWMGHWQHAIENIYSDQVEVARFLDALPNDEIVVCDEPTIEGLTKLRFDRVARVNIDSAETRARIEALLDSQGSVHVASWLGKIERLPYQREIVFRPKNTLAGGIPGEGHPDKKAGLAVVRLDR